MRTRGVIKKINCLDERGKTEARKKKTTGRQQGEKKKWKQNEWASELAREWEREWVRGRLIDRVREIEGEKKRKGEKNEK